MLIPALALALAAAPVHRYALVLGSNTGEGVSAAALRYADDDALSMHELLLEAGVESVLLATPDADTIRLHPQTKPIAPPTLDALKGAFAAQRASMLRAQESGETIEWFFFFSGHGDVDRGEGFLGLERGKLTRKILHDELLAKIPPTARAHVILDACRSGALVGSKGPGGGVRLAMPSAFAADATWSASTGFLLSSSSVKESHEYDRYQSGVFSFEVRSALRGAADANADGTVTYAELGAFLETANRGIDNPRFRPEFVTLPPKGREGLEVPLLTWPQEEEGRIELTLEEHAYIERANGERLLDVHTRTHATRLHLPSERPLFVRSDDEQREATVDGTNVITVLQPKTNATAQKGALDRALTQLFAVAFEPQNVETFTSTWQPAELTTFTLPEPPTSAIVARHAAGWLTIGAVIASGVSFGIAWQQSGPDDARLDQLARVQRNNTITAANTLGVAGLGLAVVTAVTWAILTLKYDLPVFTF
ncbi:MAG: caspase family protein [Archangium sp.]